MYHDYYKEVNYLSIIIKEKSDNTKKVIASASDGFLRIWDFDIPDNLLFRISCLSDKWLIGLCLIKEKYILATCRDGNIKVFDLDKNKYIGSLSRENKEDDILFCVKQVDIKNKSYLISHSNDGLIELWEKYD